ncbi:MAG: TlpA family protein disulfide reductase [Lachnospiraceae bacterium]|nr:TlpA family protein disulfide reductase [Lachnospiraceae bacterium]
MNQKKGLIIGIVAFVVFLGAAGLLYGKLSDQVEPENPLVVEEDPGSLEDADDKEDATADTEGQGGESSEAGSDSQDAETLVTAPDFTVVDAEGNSVKLSDYFGKPIVLNFWASWCGPCQSEMPDFDETCRELEGEVQFLMVNLTDGSRETVEIAKAFIEEKGYTFPVLYDTGQEAAYQYGVSSIPSTYFIDAQGHAIARAQGAISKEILLSGIDMARGTDTQ